MQFFDTITALTLSGILTILVLYVIVVYKKGWLKRDSNEPEPYFLCPNPECRRVFKEPIWLTDLSKSPPQSYQSCPHCGKNIETSPSSTASRSLEPENTVEPMHLTDIKEPSLDAHNTKEETTPLRPETTRELPNTFLPTSASESSKKSTGLQKQKTLVKAPEIRKKTPAKLTETQKKHREKEVSTSPRTCSNFFGYLRTLPKNTPIPDECLWCPKLVNCLTGTEKLRV